MGESDMALVAVRVRVVMVVSHLMSLQHHPACYIFIKNIYSTLLRESYTDECAVKTPSLYDDLERTCH